MADNNLAPNASKKRDREQVDGGSESDNDHTEHGGVISAASYKDGSAKILHVDTNDSNDSTVSESDMYTCYLAPHHGGWLFNSYEAYEVHYKQFHTHQCIACHKNFPDAVLLNLHLAEYHDPIVDAKRARGEKVYACFVEGCDKVSRQPITRKWHLMAKHNYPANFNFGVVTHGIDSYTSLLRETPSSKRGSGVKRSKPSRPNASRVIPRDPSSGAASTSGTSANSPMTTDGASPAEATTSKQGEAPSKDVNTLADSMASLKFIPRNVRFGRGGRGYRLARS